MVAPSNSVIVADAIASINGKQPENFDASVVTVDYSRHVDWPTKNQVAHAVQLDAARPVLPPPRFPWEDHSWERPHPSVVRRRKFRAMAMDGCVAKDIVRAERDKKRKYGEFGVTPLIMSACGAIGKPMRATIDELCTQLDPDGKDLGKQSRFCRSLVQRLSVALWRGNARLAYRSAPRPLAS